jgi:LAGLIDADG DNA endonuclease family protein
VLTADNQQERLDPRWVTGFVDGEGCFHISINEHQEMSMGWQVLPEFRIVQHSRDETLLKKLQEFFKAGKVVVNHGSRKELRIRKLDELNQVMDFFERFPLMTKKRKDFEIFREVLNSMNRHEHLTHEGLERIANLCWKMNRKVKPRYLESSETLRRKSLEGD